MAKTEIRPQPKQEWALASKADVVFLGGREGRRQKFHTPRCAPASH